eukprot:jgi/Hompol1/1745/HPOL_000001-RA
MYVIADALMDAIKSMNIMRAEKDDAFCQLGLMSHINSNRQPIRSAVLPFSSVSELLKGQFTGSWIDRFGEHKSQILDLPFVADFFMFTLETMQMSGKWHRIHDFTKRFQKMFHGIYDSVLVPLLECSRQKAIAQNRNLQQPVAAAAPAEPDLRASAMVMLTYARYLNSSFLIHRIRSAKPGAPSIAVHSDFTQASDAYEKAVAAAHRESDYDVFAASSNEHGDLLFEQGNLSGACVFWSKCIDALFRRDKALASWKSILDINQIERTESWGRPEATRLLQCVNGVYNSILAATAVSKMARFYYFNNHDKRIELVWFAAHLYIAPIMATIPHPINYLDYATYTPQYIFPFLNIFADKFQCNPSTLCDCLAFLTHELLAIDNALITLPLISLIEHVSLFSLQSFLYSARAIMLKAEALVSIGKISEAIAKVSWLAKRTSLSVGKRDETPDPTSPVFDDKSFPIRNQHAQALKQLAWTSITEKAKQLYPQSFIAEFELFRSHILIKIVEISGLAMPFQDGQAAHSMFDLLDVGEVVLEDPSSMILGSADQFVSE